MAYDVTQIKTIVNDAVSDALGKNAGVKKLDTTNFVSLGKSLSNMGLLEGWFSSLAKRISETIYFSRVYDGKKRSVLRNEHEYGAFVQKVYTAMPDAVDNLSWDDLPDGNGDYKQANPYGIEDSLTVSALIFGGKGTWSIEVVRPIVQIKNAFLNESAMMAFIDALYVEINNSFALEVERVQALAVNTAMALSLSRGKSINVLNLYNMAHDSNVITTDAALENADFHKVVSATIGETIENMKSISVTYSPYAWPTFTDEDRLVVEVLAKYAKNADVYLQSDTFHNELTKLPNYEKVSFWQSAGNARYALADVSKIYIKNSGIKDVAVYNSDTVEQDGIIAYLHDIESCAASFYDKRSWELVNPRSEVLNHGDKCEVGYSVDGHANGVVIFMENTNDITVSGDAGATLKYSHAYAGYENVITCSAGKAPSATGVTFTQIGSTSAYKFTPSSNAAIAITVANA